MALGRGDRVYHRHHLEARAHNRLLLPMIDEVLNEAGLQPAELDAVVFGRGPGSFTGLRLAAAVTQGLAWAQQLPVLGVSSLEVLAAQALERQPDARGAIVLIDARMDECYWNAFAAKAEGLEALGEDGLARPATMDAELALRCGTQPGTWLLVGAEHWPEQAWPAWQGCEFVVMDGIVPDARTLLTLARPRLEAGQGRPAGEAVPVYLRDASRWRKLDEAPAERQSAS